MTAYFVASISSHDQSWLATYGAMVPAIVRRHGGELVCRSEEFKCYEGGNDSPDYVVILTFPSMQAIDAFMNGAGERWEVCGPGSRPGSPTDKLILSVGASRPR